MSRRTVPAPRALTDSRPVVLVDAARRVPAHFAQRSRRTVRRSGAASRREPSASVTVSRVPRGRVVRAQTEKS
jgi:hypothetical protein